MSRVDSAVGSFSNAWYLSTASPREETMCAEFITQDVFEPSGDSVVHLNKASMSTELAVVSLTSFKNIAHSIQTGLLS